MSAPPLSPTRPGPQPFNRYGLLRRPDDEHAFVLGNWAELAPRACAVGLWGGLLFAAGTLADLLLMRQPTPWGPLLLTRLLVLALGLRLAWVTRPGATPDVQGLRLWMALFQVAVLLGLRVVVQLHGQVASYQGIAAVLACVAIYAYAPMLRPPQFWFMPLWLALAVLQQLALLHAAPAEALLFLVLLGCVNIIGWSLATHANRVQRNAWLDRRRLQAEFSDRVAAEQNLRHLFEASPVPLVLAGWPHGQLLHVNQAALDLLDPQRALADPMLAQAADFYADPQTASTLGRSLARHDAIGPLDLRMKDSARRVLDVMLSARRLRYDGRRAVLASLVEITHRKRHEHELRRLAHTDALTGLHNRRGFFARAERISRDPALAPLALLVLDVDHFKSINDRHVHAIGDLVLQQLAGRMSSVLRDADLLARIGGEEFAALLCGTSSQQAWELAERLRCAVCEHELRCQGLRLSLSVSVGVALLDAGETDWEAALARADDAMYRAKQAGRNQVCPRPAADAAADATA